MDVNLEYAAPQHVVICADTAASNDQRAGQLPLASAISGRICACRPALGSAAACAWSAAQVSAFGSL